MNLIKSLLIAPVLKQVVKNKLISAPEIIDLNEIPCIGYFITTSVKGNKKKEDIPRFFHDIYDNHKLKNLWLLHEKNMYCIFSMHQNKQDFDYFIATENKLNLHDKNYAEITIPNGKYVRVTVLKRNQSAIMKIMMYLKAIWIEKNGFKPLNTPAFMMYDERFHTNYEKHGCVDGNYLGNPVATLYLPVEKNK